LYDTEINFGDADDPTSPGAQTVMRRADADYGPGLPANFAGMPWEESRWLGFFIKERAIIMSKDPTWVQDMDQIGTWEAALRLHTATSNNPESATDLSMGYDIVSAYKASSTGTGSASAQVCPSMVTPCFGDPPLASNWDTCATVFIIGPNMSASAADASAADASAADGGSMDPTTWTAMASAGGGYASCPSNPTP
jgi:hypothetical protein